MSLKSSDFERIRMTNTELYSNVIQVFGHLMDLYQYPAILGFGI